MTKETFRINGVDYSSHVQEGGIKRTYYPVKGLGDKMTMDKKRHTDLLGYKRTVTVAFNSTDAETTAAILSDYASGLLFITVYDPKTKSDVTFLAEPGTVGDAQITNEAGDIIEYQLDELTFEEV